jgi:ribose transport system ATP-binding protein
MSTQELIFIENISKRFGGTQALNNITFKIIPGEIHAIIGENGAGKSTLINILSGIIKQDSGRIYFKGSEISNVTPKKIGELGIATVYQELNLFPNRDTAQNIFVGHELLKNGIFIDKASMYEKSADLLKELGIGLDLKVLVKYLSIANQQLIEIAKIILHKANVVIMDEPNSALTDRESKKLFEIIFDMKKRGVTVIYVSHKIEEVIKLADRITILRDGHYIDTLIASKVEIKQVVSLMIGRRFEEMFPTKESTLPVSHDTIFEIRNLSREREFQGISFFVKKGEIVGLFGLEGSGKNDIAETIFGVKHPNQGEIFLDNKLVKIDSPIDAIRKGIAYVPSDRKQEGLILSQSVGNNVVLNVIDKISRFGVISFKELYELTKTYTSKLAIQYASITQKVINLSGGNQQKVVLSKNLVIRPRLIIMNEPTRGIDVGAKKQIYELMVKLAAQGMCIIFISSELPEIIALSDRILVLSNGEVKGEFLPEKTTKEELLAFACG